MSKDLKELEGKIGYKFDDFTLFTKAMIHSSYANEKHLPKYECNERLESEQFILMVVLLMQKSLYIDLF